MYYLYLALWYLSLRATSSYVLLAANMDDFRSLAKKFVPENIADQFLPKPTVAILRDNSKYPRSKKSDIEPSMFQAEEENSSVKQKHKYAKRTSKHKKPKTNFEVQLDELVARVKESLQKDWSVFLTTNDGVKNAVKSKHNAYTTTEIAMKNEAFNEFDGYTSGFSQSVKQVRYVKQTRDDTKDKHREKDRNVGEEKYVENSSVEENHAAKAPLSKPSIYLDTEKLKSAQHVRPNKVTIKKPRKPKKFDPRDDDEYLFDTPYIKPTDYQELTTVSEDPVDLLKETDIRQLKDSYEDYAIPKKDDDYEKFEPVKNNKKKKGTRTSSNDVNKKNSNNLNYVDKGNYKNNRDDQNDRDKKDSDLFEENKEEKSMYKIYGTTGDDDETINYNKKNKVVRKPKRPPNSLFFHTPDADDNIFGTSEVPTSQKGWNQISELHHQNQKPHNIKKTNIRYAPSRIDVEDAPKQPEISNGPSRLVEVHDGSKSDIVAPPSSMYLEQERPPPKNVIPSNKKQPIYKHDIEKKRKSHKQKPNKNKKPFAETGTEDELHILKGFDLLRKDSYEDYVTPKKDDNLYDEEDPSKHDLKYKASLDFLRDLADNFERDHKNDAKVNDDDYNDNKKADAVVDDYETTNYNKKRKSTNNNAKEEHQLQNALRKLNVASEILPLPTVSNLEKSVDDEELEEPRRHIDDLLMYKKVKNTKMRPERFLLEEMMKGRRND